MTRTVMLSEAEASSAAATLMTDFAARTGITSESAGQRYLWTDAFAVCNFLALARLSGETRYAQLALRLVDRVHHALGRHREDDVRRGWISGLSEEEGEAHPTCGGLRIGKPLPERGPHDPLDAELEWERDGQYFHYLTKWMHALDQLSRAVSDARFHGWARELAQVAHAAFVRGTRGARRMCWKMSIDLTRPLISSTGQHDALDGLITCAQIESTTTLLAGAPADPSLEPAIADFGQLLEARELTTHDPLGLGGLLTDAYRVAQLMSRRALDGDLLEQLLTAAQPGLALHATHSDLKRPAQYRLAFRELGLAIGLRALSCLERDAGGLGLDARVRAKIADLAPHVSMGDEIIQFWLAPNSRASDTWREHRDINEVMLATSLVPEDYLRVTPC